ncbi:glutamyl-tRNA amidotransferase [Phlyctema vagabunda]|uniref:Glutamyl-tRNA amidotransferase n=1 Tax=Phlyctema vagabunda TaxID=108571 RepID=A0ABR4P4F7_9HELO
MVYIVSLLASLLASAALGNTASSRTGSTLNVDGVFYYVPATPVSALKASPDQLKSAATYGEDLVPLTIIETSASSFDAAALQGVISSYEQEDDVFSSGFLQAIYLQGTTSAAVQDLSAELSAFGTKLFLASAEVGCTTDIPSGPYFLSIYTGDIFQAYRLYSDVDGAFTEGVIANKDGNYSTLSASIQGVQSVSIGVPSRLYYSVTESQPLAGVRIGIKDIFDVAGTKRGCGNRAYYDLYPERNTTAPAVQRLVDAGAIIVGKMKTSQFANGAMATADWVDYHSPFNARGEGYSDPSSSSSGPGAGVGAYSWLDIALGSDTGGSIRNPAQVNGAYGNRPSHALVPLDNVMPLSPLLDTAGFLCRDAHLWKTASHVLYGENITSITSFPKKLYTTGFPENVTTEAEGVLLNFLSKLEEFLGTTSSVLDYDAMWEASSEAAKANASTLSDLLALTYPTLIAKQQYSLFGAPFIADYGAAHDGRHPFLDPNPLVRWTWAQTNETVLEDGIANKTIFMDWWNTQVIPADPVTCSDSLLLYPGTLATPNYRNVYFEAPDIPSGWGVYNIAIFAEAPDMVFPLGQAAYNSTITLHEEFLPVAVDVIAHKGCDGMILELATQLQDAGITILPKAGSSVFRRGA